MAEKVALLVFSGTTDRLLPAGIIASGAAAMGMDVEMFFTFWGLNASRKENLGSSSFSGDYDHRELERRLSGYPQWHQLIREAKRAGNVKVHACAMTFDMMGMKMEDLADFFDDVIGVGEFLERAKDANITLFI